MLDAALDDHRISDPGRLRKYLLRIFVVLLLAVLAMLGYTDLAEMHLREEIRSAERDPATGVIVGTEALTLPGTGRRACLLIHGWIGSRIDFNDLGLRLNEKGLTVRMLRLPGHGTTPRELEKVAADELVRAAEAEFLDLKRSHEEVALVGFSMGGSLATIVASRHPADRLVLVAPFYAVTYKWYYLLTPEMWNRILSPIVTYVIKADDFIRVNRAEAKKYIFTYKTVPTRSVSVLCELGRRARARELLGRIACPVLMAVAQGDMAASPAAMEEAFGLLASGERELFRCGRSNHHILWDHDGEAAAERIVEFLVAE
jgi:carboxylesterase